MSLTAQATINAVKKRSYKVRVHKGDIVKLRETISRRGSNGEIQRLYRNQAAVVISETNAGFRGIVATIQTSTGVRFSDVSTGLLDIVQPHYQETA